MIDGTRKVSGRISVLESVFPVVRLLVSVRPRSIPGKDKVVETHECKRRTVALVCHEVSMLPEVYDMI
jgi:hypothetical protein